MFYIIVILAAIFAMPAQAQSLRDRVVGAWSFVSCNQAATAACGTSPNGILIYDASLDFHATEFTSRALTLKDS
jgi:hypothetical protein